MNRVDLSHTVSVPAGELTLLDALENAAQFLRDSDTGCALVQAAGERLDAVLSDIRQQRRKANMVASLFIRLESDGRINIHHGGDLSALLDYLGDAMKLVHERRAGEVQP